jgi:hypothetical protein
MTGRGTDMIKIEQRKEEEKTIGITYKVSY